MSERRPPPDDGRHAAAPPERRDGPRVIGDRPARPAATLWLRMSAARAGAATQPRVVGESGAVGQAEGPALGLDSPAGRAPRLRHGLSATQWIVIRAGIDLLTLAGAVILALPAQRLPGLASPEAPLLLLPVVSVLTFFARGLYRRRLILRFTRALPVLGALAVATAALALLSAATTSRPLDGGFWVRAWLIAALCLIGARLAVAHVERGLRVRGQAGEPTLIIGTGGVATAIVERLLAQPGYGLRPVGSIDNVGGGSGAGRTGAVPMLGDLDALERVVAQTGVAHVIVAFSVAPDEELAAAVRRCRDLGLRVALVPRLYDAFCDRVDYEVIGGLPLLALHPVHPRGWQFALKHGIDRVAAAALLVLLSPVLVGLAATIRATSPGPALFRQRRVGRGGVTFDMFKFRTMTGEGHPHGFTPTAGHAPGGVEGRDRRTAVGRWLRRCSLDELPQLLNVLRGEMSLIGPRPERPEFVELFQAEIPRYHERHAIKPGMTGWAQAHGLRGQTSLSDRIEWDTYYIDHWSMVLDLRIIALTVMTAFRTTE